MVVFKYLTAVYVLNCYWNQS